MVLPPLDFESSASAISPPRLQVATGKIIASNALIKKKPQIKNLTRYSREWRREKDQVLFIKQQN